MSARVSSPPARAPRGRPPRFQLHSEPGVSAPAAFGLAAWVLIGVYAVVLAWVAFGLHKVGDYSTESDFYGGYAEGARLIQHGRLDPARYPVVGPGYEVVLALVGFVVRDLFTAARLISVVSALAAMILWRGILVRRAGPGLAFWALAFLAVNAVWFRYAWSATTDMLAIGLQAATMYCVLAAEGRRAALVSGVLAALATLTRYNYVFLVPAAIACYVWLAPPERGGRARAVWLHLAGFALVAVPWFAWSIAMGHVPGASLFSQFGSFYTVNDATRNVQDQLPAVAESLAAARAANPAAGGGFLPTVLRVLGGIPDHLRQDAVVLLEWPTALACLAGLVLSILDGTWRRLAPVWVFGALAFAALVPVFYSDRYSMAVAPAWMTLAAAAASSRLLAARLSPPGLHLKWLVALIPIALTIRAGVPEQRRLLGNQPIEVIGAGRVLARESRPEDRVISRKGHVGFYGGRSTIPFPRVVTLRDLAARARDHRARFLYYSWYEAMVRPEFAFLLDTTAVVPGLTRIYSATSMPAVLFRVGEEFGQFPPWMANRYLVKLHYSRAVVRFQSPDEAAVGHEYLASYALDQGDPATALEHIEAISRAGRLSPMAWRLAGDALRVMGRAGRAAEAYREALTLNPADYEARLGLGWAWLGLGDLNGAAQAWRGVIGPGADSTSLAEMVALFTRLGDHSAAEAARRELANQRAGH